MAAKQSHLTVLFADISGSTSLYERLGDLEARRHVVACLSTITAQVKRHAGTVIKPIGDELMCTFPNAQSALDAAMAMQSAFTDEDQALANKDIDMAIRVGFHAGPVIQDGGDVFGDTVNVAARIAGLAKAGQIITTQATFDQLPPASRAMMRLLDYTPVKGKSAEISIFEVLWQGDEATRLATSVLAAPLAAARLLLRYGEEEMLLDRARPRALLGRSEPCDIIVNSERVSRQHARIEYRRGKYVVVDQSTNGTYVSFGGEEEVFLRREEMPLRGRGTISLGLRFDKAPEALVHFVCESCDK